jgi:hypothetical protein
MSQGAIIGGVVVVMICCSASSAAMMMGGEDDSIKTPTGPGPAAIDILYDEKTMPYPAGGHTELGAATSVAACRTLAKAGNHTSFGYRKSTQPGDHANTCFAYNNSSELNDKTPIDTPNHVVGCADPTKDITKGCSDILYDEKTMPYPAGGHTELGAGTSVGACRTLAKAGNHTNFGYRKSTQPGEYANTCWAFNVPSELNGKTPEDIANHVVGCVDPTKDITKGCV